MVNNHQSTQEDITDEQVSRLLRGLYNDAFETKSNSVNDEIRTHFQPLELNEISLAQTPNNPFSGRIVFNTATNEIKIYTSSDQPEVSLNLKLDSSGGITGMQVNNHLVDLEQLNARDYGIITQTNTHYGTSGDNLEVLDNLI